MAKPIASRPTRSASRCCAATPGSIRNSIRSCGSRRRGCAAPSNAITPGRALDDPIVIDLPRGTYVPTFRRREARRQCNGANCGSRLAGRAAFAAGARGPGRGHRAAADRWRRCCCDTLVSSGEAVGNATARDIAMRPDTRSLPPGNGMPAIFIEPMRVIGTPPAGALAVDPLFEKINDAFARFDTINVVYAPHATRRRPIAVPAAPRVRLSPGRRGRIPRRRRPARSFG